MQGYIIVTTLLEQYYYYGSNIITTPLQHCYNTVSTLQHNNFVTA